MRRTISVLCCGAIIAAAHGLCEEIRVRLRSQSLKADAGGHNYWDVLAAERTIRAEQTAIIICDIWDKHWSRGATQRVAAMTQRMNEVVKAARAGE